MKKNFGVLKLKTSYIYAIVSIGICIEIFVLLALNRWKQNLGDNITKDLLMNDILLICSYP